MWELAPGSPWKAILRRVPGLGGFFLLIVARLAQCGPFPNPRACRRQAAQFRPMPRRYACRPRARAAVRASRDARAATAAVSRTFRAPRGETRRARCDDRVAPRRRAPRRG